MTGKNERLVIPRFYTISNIDTQFPVNLHSVIIATLDLCFGEGAGGIAANIVCRVQIIYKVIHI